MLRVATEQKQYFPSEKIKGNVMLKLQAPIEILEFVIKIRCIQTVDVKRTGSNLSSKKGRYMLCQRNAVPSAKGRLGKGNHSFQFKESVSSTFPPSFALETSKFNAAIKYEILAEMKVKHQRELIESTCDFAVISKPPRRKSNPEPSEQFSVRKSIRRFGMMTRGLMEIVGRLNQQRFGVGDTIEVSTYVRNASAYNVLCLQLELRQYVYVKTRSKDAKSTLGDQQVLLKSEHWVTVASNDESTVKNHIQIPTTGVMESLQSKLILCRHFLTVIPQFQDAKAGVTNVELSIPLEIRTHTGISSQTPVVTSGQQKKMRVAPSRSSMPEIRRRSLLMLLAET